MRASAEATPPCSAQEMVVDEGAKREKQSTKREADAEADIKATPSKRTRAFAVKPSPKSAKPIAKKPAAVPPGPRPVCKRVLAPIRRPCLQKVPAPPAYKLTTYEEVCKAELRYPSQHPHVELEDEMLLIKSAPTPPSGRLEASIDNGDLCPDVFCAFIAVLGISQAPPAGPSQDRKALRSFSEATKGDNVEALVCFCCVHSHMCC